MSTRFQVDLVDIDGNIILQDLAFERLDYSRSFASVGSMSMILGPGYDSGRFERDSLFRIWRTPEGGGTSLEAAAIWFLREKEVDLNTGIITFKCEDQMGLLRRRIVGYRSQTILADHAIDGTNDFRDPADDMMKDYVRENMGPNAVWPVGGAPDTERDLEPRFVVAANESLAPIVSETASMKKVFDTLKTIRDKARAVDGTEVFFDIKADLNGVFTFRTLIGSLGVSQQGNIGGLIFSPENGSLTKATLTWDWSKEITYVYAGVEGHTSSHDVQRFADPTSPSRTTATYWNRIEEYLGVEDDTQIQQQAEAVINSARPKILLDAETVDTPDIIYGIHYFYGDSVWVQAGGYKFLCHIHSMKNRVSDGGESLTINLVGEIPTTS